MAMAQVPVKTMMHITGHKSASSLDKYNELLELEDEAAQLAI